MFRKQKKPELKIPRPNNNLAQPTYRTAAQLTESNPGFRSLSVPLGWLAAACS